MRSWNQFPRNAQNRPKRMRPRGEHTGDDGVRTDAKCDGTSTRKFLNPSTVKLFNWNFHPLEVVSRWRDSQLQVSENYSDLTKRRSTNFKSCWLLSLFIFNMVKSWYVLCYKKCKKHIWTAPAVKGLIISHAKPARTDILFCAFSCRDIATIHIQ